MSRRRPAPGQRSGRDRGSVTPLLIGMVVCLLLLTTGVIAAGSAVLAKRDLQSACDGAADAVSGQVTTAQLAVAGPGTFDRQAAAYLGPRLPRAQIGTDVSGTAVIAVCRVRAPVTFGALFGSPTVELDVRSVSQLQRG